MTSRDWVRVMYKHIIVHFNLCQVSATRGCKASRHVDAVIASVRELVSTHAQLIIIRSLCAPTCHLRRMK